MSAPILFVGVAEHRQRAELAPAPMPLDRLRSEAVEAEAFYRRLNEAGGRCSLLCGRDALAEQLQWAANLSGASHVLFERGALHQTPSTIIYPDQSRMVSGIKPNEATLVRQLAMRTAGVRDVVLLPMPDCSQGSVDVALLAAAAALRAGARLTISFRGRQICGVNRPQMWNLAQQADLLQLSSGALARLLGPRATGSVATWL
ncbi:MAG TPA: hypothetical protein PKC18_08435 [Lacipirellulaceae bacterium]|nr:hypothetical protein [Lacipirellulaceae bacterium]